MTRSRLVLALVVSVSTVAALLVGAPASAVFMYPSLYDAPRNGVITDPAETEGRSLTMSYSVQNPTQAVSWELRNSADALVLGPYDLGEKTGYANYQFPFDPTALNSGVALPDGTYTIVLTISADGETPLSAQTDVNLAFDPPRDSTVEVLEAQRDVWPGFVRHTFAAVDRSHGRLVTALLPSVVLPEFGSASRATFTVRNSAGTLVRRDTVSGSSISDGGGDDQYEWTWDGTNEAGQVRPPGDYGITLTANDNWGRSATVPVGSMRIGHLVNRTTTVRFEPVKARNAYLNVLGRCSRVTYPGPHRWPSSGGLLSNVRCAGRAGTADQVFKTFFLKRNEYVANRVLSVRVDAYGVPMRPQQYATLLLDKGRRNIAFRRVAVLGDGLRWHNGTTDRTPAGPAHGQLAAWAQVRVTNGNKYDLKYLRATWTYRAWTR